MFRIHSKTRERPDFSEYRIFINQVSDALARCQFILLFLFFNGFLAPTFKNFFQALLHRPSKGIGIPIEVDGVRPGFLRELGEDCICTSLSNNQPPTLGFKILRQ